MSDGRISLEPSRSASVSSLALLALLMAGLTTCRNQEEDASGQRGGGTFSSSAAGGDILCAVGGATELQRGCSLDRSQGSEGPLLTIRNPNGGFRRFLIVSDGRGVVPADGSEGATIKISQPGMIDLRVGGDLYRLPATFRSSADKRP